MSKNTYPLKLPTSVKKAAAELAANDGVSLNQFIAAAVAEKVGSLRAADDFLRERAGTAKPKDMHKYLRRAPTVANRPMAPYLESATGRIAQFLCFWLDFGFARARAASHPASYDNKGFAPGP